MSLFKNWIGSLFSLFTPKPRRAPILDAMAKGGPRKPDRRIFLESAEARVPTLSEALARLEADKRIASQFPEYQVRIGRHVVYGGAAVDLSTVHHGQKGRQGSRRQLGKLAHAYRMYELGKPG